jgi:hypothetical protein
MFNLRVRASEPASRRPRHVQMVVVRLRFLAVAADGSL